MYNDFMIVKQKGFPTYCVITDKTDDCELHVVYPYVDRKTYLKGRWNEKVKDWVVYPLVEVFYHDKNCYHLWKDPYGHVMCSLHQTHKEYLRWSKWYAKWSKKHPPIQKYDKEVNE